MEHVMLSCGHAANATDGNGQPACAICVGLEKSVPVAAPNLTGREARCGKFCAVVPSSLDLAFFEFRGEGSPVSKRTCKKCGYADVAHDPAHMQRNVPSNRKTVVEQGKCSGFEPHGAYEYDTYYCGCRGWD